jgi:putative ABC transport system permease protein
VRLGLRELLRRPRTFAGPTLALLVLSLLLLFLTGLLDGLYRGSTGAIRAQQADVFVYSDTSRESFLRSRIEPDVRAAVEDVAGVDRVGGLGIALLAAEVPGETEFADVAVIGYELAPEGVGEPPAPGIAYADERLKGFGVELDQTILVGPARVPIQVAGFVRDTNYLLQGALWVDPSTWRTVQNANRPDARVGEDIFQVLVVQGEGPASQLATAIDQATEATVSLSKPDAVLSIPGTREQRTTFNQIIGTTYLIAAVVTALFFVLRTLERIPLFGVLKALGGSSWQLFTSLAVQAIAVATIAFIPAAALAALFAANSPPQFPFDLEPGRFIQVLVILVVCAIGGSLASLRRVRRIDPAQAIGSGT